MKSSILYAKLFRSLDHLKIIIAVFTVFFATTASADLESALFAKPNLSFASPLSGKFEKYILQHATQIETSEMCGRNNDVCESIVDAWIIEDIPSTMIAIVKLPEGNGITFLPLPIKTAKNIHIMPLQNDAFQFELLYIKNRRPQKCSKQDRDILVKVNSSNTMMILRASTYYNCSRGTVSSNVNGKKIFGEVSELQETTTNVYLVNISN